MKQAGRLRGVILFLAGLGCMPKPYSKQATSPRDDKIKNAYDFCTKLENGGKKVAVGELTAGILFAAAASGALAASTILASGDVVTSAERGAIIGMPILAGLFGIGSGLLIARSRDASELAGAATLTLDADSDEDGVAKQCNAALAAWHSRRSAAAAVVQEQLNAERAKQAGKQKKAGNGGGGGGGGTVRSVDPSSSEAVPLFPRQTGDGGSPPMKPDPQ